ncbi:MAG: RloB family protein [Oscillospiraceae bacterium]|nr:RloB family protein [Oscillospiraceae bacterium]
MSVPCFEIWYLLHFGYTTKCFTSNKKLVSELKSKIKDYDKSSNVKEKIWTLLEKNFWHMQNKKEYYEKEYIYNYCYIN